MTAEHIDDITAVRSVIQLYIDGADGDVELLREAFHPSAWMFGHIGPIETNEPISEFIEWVGAHPGMAGERYRADIRSIEITGDAGVAVLVESDWYGSDFVDYFTVARIDGRWWITGKTYAHTGGFPPEG